MRSVVGAALAVLLAAVAPARDLLAAPPAPVPGAKTAEGRAPAAPTAEQRAAALRKKAIKGEDFVDNDDQNRDPFRSYLRLFAEKATIKTRKMPAVFDKYSLEELTLIAIVSGDAVPRAMFRDPTGLGQVVRKGDYLSKSGVRVGKILSDRVIIEVPEVSAAGETRTSERAIRVNPEDSR